MDPLEQWEAAAWQRMMWTLPPSRDQFKQLVLECMKVDPAFKRAMQLFVASPSTGVADEGEQN